MWLDRVTGRKVTNLPETIESSRYAAIGSASINDHTELSAGALLVDDGTGGLREGEATISFLQADLNEDVLVEQDIINTVLLEFEHAVAHGKQASFLIPEVLLDRLHLQSFDTFIKETIDKGHFQEIARSPKMELVYQEHLLPVGRVKKFPASASRHLAAHSECWQKRSFTGVVPRSLLALESEDEYNIYENRVYARLLDHLDRYLQRRCREVSRIEDAIAEAISFEASESLYFGLTHSVCHLWGEGFKGGKVVTEEAEKGQGTLQTLRSLLREIRGLRGSKLYKMIPKGDDIGFEIRMTNTLSHDQHYRHVARLWHLWLEYSQEGRVDPGLQYSNNTDYAKAYCSYVSRLVIRAINELGYDQSNGAYKLPSGQKISVLTKNDNICLGMNECILTIVPIFSQLSDTTYMDLELSDSVIAVSPGLVDFDLEIPAQTASPLYFYSLEAMVSRLSSWISKQTVSLIGQGIQKIPAGVSKILKNEFSKYFLISGTTAFLKLPLCKHIDEVRDAFKMPVRDPSTTRFLKDLDSYSIVVDSLLVCPLCGEETRVSNFHPREDNGFNIEGFTCKHVWEINRDKHSNRFLFAGPMGNDSVAKSGLYFRNYGRYMWQVKITS